MGHTGGLFIVQFVSVKWAGPVGGKQRGNRWERCCRKELLFARGTISVFRARPLGRPDVYSETSVNGTRRPTCTSAWRRPRLLLFHQPVSQHGASRGERERESWGERLKGKDKQDKSVERDKSKAWNNLDVPCPVQSGLTTWSIWTVRDKMKLNLSIFTITDSFSWWYYTYLLLLWDINTLLKEGFIIHKKITFTFKQIILRQSERRWLEKIQP